MTGRLQLRFPREVRVDDVEAGLLALSGLSGRSGRTPFVFSALGSSSGIEHLLFVPPADAARVQRQLGAAVAGLTFAPLVSPDRPQFAWRLWQSTGRRPFAVDRSEQVARALLVALSPPLTAKEMVGLHWRLGPVRRPQAVGSRPHSVVSESWPLALASAAFRTPGELDADARRALRSKLELPGWRAVAYVVVTADNPARAQQLARTVIAALRTAEGAGSHFGIRRSRPRAVERTPWRWNLFLNVRELPGLLAWPIGGSADGLGVAQRTSVLLPPPRAMSRNGRLLGRASTSNQAIYLGRAESLQHLHIIGPTGTGKSTLLINLILQDIAAGASVVALDPKGQLVDDVLRRYPDNRRDGLVVLDPSSSAPVGFNPLAAPGEPALIADQLLGIFSKLYADSWGPRTADVMQASLLTLARTPGASLAMLPLLLTNPTYRRRLVGGLDDPLGLGPFWAWYERLSDAERGQVIAPSLNKVRPFLLRPDLRSVIGQARPRFDLRDVFTRPRVLLVNLAKGSLGPEGSSLLGSVLLNQLWQTTLSRGGSNPDKLRPVYLYIDEMQDFLRLPGDVGELLAQARGLKVAFTLAHQHLGQLPLDLRAAVLANARSRVLFQVAPDDAAVLARGHAELTPLDLTSLGPFEMYASLQAGGSVTRYLSGVTLPSGPVTADVRRLREFSASRYGRPRAEVEAELRQVAAGTGGQRSQAVDRDSDSGSGNSSGIGTRPRRPS